MNDEEPLPDRKGGPEGIGAALKAARIDQGFSLYALAHELKLSVQILEAVEAEAWERIPEGRERPHTRQIAERLGVDLATFQAQWQEVPGVQEQEPRDPRQESLERILMTALTAGSLGLLLWLVIPGRNLRKGLPETPVTDAHPAPAAWVPTEPAGPFPVAGEVLPEAPINQDGVLVSMRAMDACEAAIQGPDSQVPPQRRSLRVSEPWRLRVKGPFTVTLDNAGVVALEVGGRHIRHGRNVGESWIGQFGPNGEWAEPQPAAAVQPTADPEPDASEEEEE